MNESTAQQQQSTNDISNYSMFKESIEPQMNDAQVRWLLEAQDIIQNLENRFAGRYWNYSEKRWNEDPNHKVMNDVGLMKIMGMIESLLIRNTMVSNLTQHDINTIMKNFMITLTKTIRLNYEQFEIKRADFDLICQTIETPIQMTLKRALDQGERNLLRDTSKRVENVKYGNYSDNSGSTQQASWVNSLFSKK